MEEREREMKETHFLMYDCQKLEGRAASERRAKAILISLNHGYREAISERHSLLAFSGGQRGSASVSMQMPLLSREENTM